MVCVRSLVPNEKNSAVSAISPASRQARGDEVFDDLLLPVDRDGAPARQLGHVDAVIVANLLHVSPPETLAALCEGAAMVLPPGGVLHIYGPFKRHGAHTSTGNTEFDRSLRERNPAWGIRDLERVVEVAAANQLIRQEVVAMPANNFSLVFALDAGTGDS